LRCDCFAFNVFSLFVIRAKTDAAFAKLNEPYIRRSAQIRLASRPLH